jgi:SAM-dependent methyltransferase
VSYLKQMAEQGYTPHAIGPFHEFMIPWLLRAHHIPTDTPVIDIGAGQGHALLPLHRNGWHNLIAVDIEDVNFPLFEREYGIRTVRCDIGTDALPLEAESAGAVICLHLIEHLRDASNLLREVHRVLRPGGKAFLVTPDWRKQYKTFWRDPTHVHPYDKESLLRLLQMHGFNAAVTSWNAAWGLGRLRAYRWFPFLGMIGTEMIAIAER